MSSGGLRHELPRALLIVWLVLGALSGAVILIPFVIPSSFLLNLFPVCAAKAAGGSCILCGMTTAFVAIGAGDLTGAQAAHRGALAVYGILALNFAGSAAYTMMRVKRHAIT